jgi:hypothetical protein
MKTHNLTIDSKTFLNSGITGKIKKLPATTKFWALDSEELFNKNLEALPEDWRYRTQPVEYCINSLGYRAPEFDQVDWKNSVVMFGCSTTFGDGVNQDDTIPAQLSKIIGRPVINMGAGGSGQMWSLHNAIVLKEYYTTPVAVVNFWPSIYRTTTYNMNGPEKQGPWNENSIYQNWIQHGNAESQAYFTHLLSKNIWHNNAIYYDFTWCDIMSYVTGCDMVPEESVTKNGNYKNLARDLCHQGPESLKCIAEHVAKKLCERGLGY